MLDTLHNPETPETKRRRSSATIIVGAVLLLAAGLSVWTLLRMPQTPPTQQARETTKPKMSVGEQDYAKNIQIEKIALSRAENFIHQEVTTMSADVVNGGTLSVQALTVTVVFLDDMKQVVLRESRGVLGAPPVPLAPGERRAFEISFDHVPASWNMEQPAVNVSYLQLSSNKIVTY